MKTLTVERMESIEGGLSLLGWLEIGCISGGILMSLASGPAAPLVASLTIHACGGYILSKFKV